MEITKELILAKLAEKEDVLSPRQGKISLPIVSRIYKKMKHNLKFSPISVRSDGLINNGHHRYISSILADFDVEVIYDYPKSSNLNAYDWNSVDFVTEDWDTTSKIRMLNEEDARYNEMAIEDVERIIG